jgi:hypothetical protein
MDIFRKHPVFPVDGLCSCALYLIQNHITIMAEVWAVSNEADVDHMSASVCPHGGTHAHEQNNLVILSGSWGRGSLLVSLASLRTRRPYEFSPSPCKKSLTKLFSSAILVSFTPLAATQTGHLSRRGVAQPGSALQWGCSGRRFKSSHPDLSNANTNSHAERGVV